MKTEFIILIIIGIIVAVAGILVFTTIVFDDFAIYLCDSWFFNICVKIWEDPDCHRPGSGCIMSDKPASEQLQRIFDYCNTKGTGIAMIQPRYTYSNDTHYIDNGTCEWTPVYDSENISFRDFTDKQLERLGQVLHLCEDTKAQYLGAAKFENSTHRIDSQTCTWKILDENPHYTEFDGKVTVEDQCTENIKCYGHYDNGIKIQLSCDGMVMHGCGMKSFDNYTEIENEN